MKYRFADLADIPKLQELMGSLYWLTDVAIGIIEADGTFLFCAGWRGTCQSSHDGVCECQAYIAKHLDPVSYTSHRCPTGMLHYACPIVVEGVHMASVYIGQFFTEPPDETAARLQATARGLNTDELYKELKKFAVVPPMHLTLLLKYLNDLANMLADIGLQRLKQMETLEILRLNEERLQYISRHDPLTGLLNRVAFEDALTEMETAPALPFALMVLDLDGLKVVNDTLGHPSGDALLCAAAEIIKEAAPSDAAVFRIGGDEFCILMPQSDETTISEVHQIMQAKIARHNHTHETLILGISAGSAVAHSMPCRLRELFKEADARMYKEKLQHGQTNLKPSIDTAIRLLRLRDYVDEGHTERLSVMCAALAAKLSFSPKAMDEMELLAHFHDIGKTALPECILNKQEKLDAEELRIMHRHCEIGHRMALYFSELTPIADFILKHHEWWNGKGYPLGIAGDGIPLQSRILGIVDAFDAMTSKRPYRPTKSVDEAIVELRQSAGKQFDPFLTEIFIEWLQSGNYDNTKNS